MRRLAIVAAIAALLAMTLPAEALASSGGVGTCTNGTMAAGTYRSFVVRGTCVIAAGANVHIRGNLVIAPGAMLDDHGAELWQQAEIHVGGNIYVGHRAVLGLGWNSPNAHFSNCWLQSDSYEQIAATCVLTPLAAFGYESPPPMPA